VTRVLVYQVIGVALTMKPFSSHAGANPAPGSTPSTAEAEELEGLSGQVPELRVSYLCGPSGTKWALPPQTNQAWEAITKTADDFQTCTKKKGAGAGAGQEGTCGCARARDG
jgi:hypothetical protein